MLKLRNLLTIAASIFLFLAFFGIIGGNSFFTIIIRSFLGTLLLSVLVLGAFIVISKIISQVPAPSVEEGLGHDIASNSDISPDGLNIVLDKENPYENQERDITSDSEDNILSSNSQSNGSSPAENLVEEVHEDAIGDISSLETKSNDGEVVEVMSDNHNDGDSLPLIDSDSDLFSNKGNSSSSKRQNEALSSLGDNATPHNMAKAIHTVMGKDEKKG